METMIVDRKQALWLVAGLLAEFEPDAKVEILKSDGTIVIRPQGTHSELLHWAERIGDKYDDVFKRLAES
jgi:virulence-associated protein VagC